MKIKLAQLAEWGKAKLVGDGQTEVNGFVLDSRIACPGTFFVALPGQNCDGRQFIADAAARGASAAMAEDEASLKGLPGIVTSDPITTLGEMAKGLRLSLNIPWIGITGSNGKTTTRELLAHILRLRGPVVCAVKSFNNNIGLPLTILNAPEGAWAGILEIGTNHPGEISALCRIANPTMAIITSIGQSHLEHFGSVAGVAAEKAMLLDALPDDGFAVLPLDADYFDMLASRVHCPRKTFSVSKSADINALNIKIENGKTSFDAWRMHFELPISGRHNIGNTLAAVAMADHLGITPAESALALADFGGVAGRLQIRQCGGVRVIDDTYNANPASLKAAAATLMEMPANRRVIIVGDMLELGPQAEKLHRECGVALARIGLDVIIAVGSASLYLAESASAASARPTVRHFPSSGAFFLRIKELLREGDLVLVKGSRGSKMEKVVAEIASAFHHDTVNCTGEKDA